RRRRGPAPSRSWRPRPRTAGPVPRPPPLSPSPGRTVLLIRGARSHMPLPPPLRLGSVRLPVFAATHSPYGHACRPRNGSVRRRDRPRLVGPEGASGGGNGASRRGGGGPGHRVEYRCRPPRRYQGSMSAFSPRLRERGRARARGPLADRDFLLLLAATLG